MAIKSKLKIHKPLFSTTLNEIYPSQSFHLDETMTVGKVISSSLISGGPYRKRALIDFFGGGFSSFDVQNNGNFNKAILSVFTANAKSLETQTQIEVSVVSGSGNMFMPGRGRRDSVPPVNEGATFAFQNAGSAVNWSSPLGQTGSNTEARTTVNYDIFGYNHSINDTQDLHADISTGLITHTGNAINTLPRFVALNFRAANENDEKRRGEVEFYSAMTQTIYQPTLYLASESTAACRTGKELGDINLSEDYILYHQNLKPSYRSKGIIKFRFAARAMYETPSFGTSSKDFGVGYIPSSSTYNFLDTKANQLLLPDLLTGSLAIESDASGHYIAGVPANLFYPYRKYQLVVNVKAGDDSSGILDDAFVLPETFQIEG